MKTLLALAAGMALAAQAAPVFAQPLDGFIKIEGVKGEVADGHYKKWMQITGVSKLPAGCRGEEGGGSLSVRVMRMPDRKQLPELGRIPAQVRFEVTDPSGEILKMTLEETYVSNTFSGAAPRAIEIGFTTADGAPTDQSDILTFNFNGVKWERTGCVQRTVATR